MALLPRAATQHDRSGSCQAPGTPPLPSPSAQSLRSHAVAVAGGVGAAHRALHPMVQVRGRAGSARAAAAAAVAAAVAAERGAVGRRCLQRAKANVLDASLSVQLALQGAVVADVLQVAAANGAE